MDRESTGCRVVRATVVGLILVLALAGCADSGAGNGGGDDSPGSGLTTVPEASDTTIYEAGSDFVLTPWDNSDSRVLEDYWSRTFTDTDGDGNMNVVVTGAPPVDDQEPVVAAFWLPAWANYSTTSPSGFVINGFEVVSDDASVDLIDIGTLTAGNMNNYTGSIYIYEFWWVSGDVRITGSGTDEGISGTLDLDLRSGWNIVRLTYGYVGKDMAGEDPLPDSQRYDSAVISSAARWIYGPVE
jgi:hypothetical protein